MVANFYVTACVHVIAYHRRHLFCHYDFLCLFNWAIFPRDYFRL